MLVPPYKLNQWHNGAQVIRNYRKCLVVDHGLAEEEASHFVKIAIDHEVFSRIFDRATRKTEALLTADSGPPGGDENARKTTDPGPPGGDKSTRQTGETRRQRRSNRKQPQQ